MSDKLKIMILQATLEGLSGLLHSIGLPYTAQAVKQIVAMTEEK
jgi:hypothetical protein